MTTLTEQQIGHYHTFGYVILKGWFSEQLATIEDEFEQLMAEHTARNPHDGKIRSLRWQMLDSSPELIRLLDGDRVGGVFDDILGDDWQYMGSAGNFYAGDTGWHVDDYARHHKVKIAAYLDPTGPDTGGLRVVPLTHRIAPFVSDLHLAVGTSRKRLGLDGREVPAIGLVTEPGDAVVFHHNILHSSWGGGERRRMLSVNAHAVYADDELPALRDYVVNLSRHLLPTVYGPLLTQDAPPERARHLKQAAAYDGDLALAVAERRSRGDEPARDLLPDLSDNTDVEFARAEFQRDAAYELVDQP